MAYLVDAMRAMLVEQHLDFLVPVVLALIVSFEVADGGYGVVVMAVALVAAVGAVVELRRPPRFRRRRWPQLVEQQGVLDDGRRHQRSL